MVTTPPNVWDDFAARKNNIDYLSWQDKSFPYFDDLICMHSMMVVMQKGELAMVWTIMQKNQRMLLVLQLNKQMRPMHISHHLLPKLLSLNQVYNFKNDEDFDDRSLDSSTPIQHMQVPPRSSLTPLQAPEPGRGKKQKAKSGSPDEGFYEKYLKLKREEMDRFAAIEEKKLKDPYNINKCITMLECLNDIQMGDILIAPCNFVAFD